MKYVKLMIGLIFSINPLLAQTTIGWLHPHSHFLKGDTDTIKVLIQSSNAIDTAYIEQIREKSPQGSWSVTEPLAFSGVAGDTFLYYLSGIRDSMYIEFTISVISLTGDTTRKTFKYNILPTSDYLIIYDNAPSGYRPDISLALSFLDLRGEEQPDTVSLERLFELNTLLIDSLYKGIIFAGDTLSFDLDTFLCRFADFGIVQTPADRKRVLVFGENIAKGENTAHRDSLFLHKILRVRYINDDFSPYTSTDTIVYSHNGKRFVINASSPDVTYPYSSDSVRYTTPQGQNVYYYINPAAPFLYYTANLISAPAGFITNELSFVSYYVSFSPSDMAISDLDTLLSVMLNFYNADTMKPMLCDSARLMGPDSIKVARDSFTEKIYGVGHGGDNTYVYGEVGYGPYGSLPWENGWTWFPPDTIKEKSCDTFGIAIKAPSTPGEYNYCYRFTIRKDTVFGPWLYADLRGTNGPYNKRVVYDYEPDYAGDMKVVYSYDVAIVAIDSVKGYGWPGFRDTLYARVGNFGLYEMEANVYLYINSEMQDSIVKMDLLPDSIYSIIFLPFYSDTGENTITILIQASGDENPQNDEKSLQVPVYPEGTFIMEEFSDWPPYGWSILPDSTLWIKGDGTLQGAPPVLSGGYAEFRTSISSQGTASSLVSFPVFKNDTLPLDLSLYYINEDGTDSLTISHRYNSGAWVTDTTLKTAATWQKYTISIPAGTKAIDTLFIRFEAVSDGGNSDIGIDSVHLASQNYSEIKNMNTPNNPLNFRSTISTTKENLHFSIMLPREMKITVAVYEISGRKVKTIFSGTAEKGTLPLVWKPLKEGVFFIRVNCPEKTYTRKILILSD